MNDLNPRGSFLTPPDDARLDWVHESDVPWTYHHSVLAGIVKQPGRLLRREDNQDKKTCKNFDAAVAAFSWCAPEKEKGRPAPPEREILPSPRTGGVWGRREESAPDWGDLLLKRGNGVTVRFPQRWLWAAALCSQETWFPLLAQRQLTALHPRPAFPASSPSSLGFALIFQNLTNSLQEQFVPRVQTGLFGFWVFSCSEMPNVSPPSDRIDFALQSAVDRKWS